MGDAHVTCHTGQTLFRVLQTQGGKRHRTRTATVVNQYGVLAHNEQWDTESDSTITHRPTTAATTTTDDDEVNGLRGTFRGRTNEDDHLARA